MRAATVILLCSHVLAIAPEPAPKPIIAKAFEFPPREGWHLVYPYEVVDGDSVKFYWLVEDSARLYGIDAPEMKTDAGKAAKKFLEKQLPPRPTPARASGRDKFGRALLDFQNADGWSISRLMVDNNHAKLWDGKGPKPK